MNWGYKIIIVYAVFVAGIMFLVIKSSTQKMDLVTTDYYAKELKFQDKIDEGKRTQALSEEIRYEVKLNQILIYFPKDFTGKLIAGNVVLYCPSDEDKDVLQNFSTQNSVVIFNIKPTNKGQNELHISWQVDGKNYYCEKKIFI